MKRLFKNLSIYGIGGIISKSVSFLLLPIYTQFLSPSDYGILSLLVIMGNVLGVFLGFMIASGFTRNYFDYSQIKDKTILFSSAFLFILPSSIIISSICFFYSDLLASFAFNFPKGQYFIKLIVISTMIQSFCPLFYAYLIVQEKSLNFISVNLFTLVITICATIIFLLFFDLKVEGVILGQIIGRFIELFLLILFVSKFIKFKFSFEAITDMLSFSLPLIPTQLSFIVLSLSDRFFLQEYKNIDDVGIYSLAYKFASIIPLFAVKPLKAWTPYIFSLIDNPHKCKNTIANFARYYWFGLLVLVLLISLFSKEVLTIMSHENFLGAWKLVFILCIGNLFYGLGNVIIFGFHIVKKTYYTSIFYIFGAIINILFNFLLIPRYGVIGASIATILSYLFILICYFIFLNKVYPIPFEYFKLISALFISIIIYYFSIITKFDLILSIFIKVNLIAIFILSLFLLNYFNKYEKSMIIKYFKKKLRIKKLG